MVNATNPAVIDYRGTFDSNETAKANLLKAGVKIAFDFGWTKAAKEAPVEEQLSTIDKEADLEMVRAVYAHRNPENRGILLMEEILQILKDNPEIEKINSEVERSAMYKS